MAAVMNIATELCIQNENEEKNQYGELLPCRKLSPLSPYLKLEEYHMLERDKGKYLLYMAAINQAMSDMVGERATERPKDFCVKCLVLGPGLGRLIRFCIDAAQHEGVNVAVHAIEANPVAVNFLRNEFANTLGKEVFVYHPFVFHPSATKTDLPEDIRVHYRTFDIVISELLGCFGDDEFLPELTSAAARMFLRPQRGIMIPQSWTSYAVPICSQSTHDFLKILKRPFDACYVMGLPADCLFLSNSSAVWSGNCYKLADEYSVDKEFTIISFKTAQLLNSKTTKNCKMCIQNLKDNSSQSEVARKKFKESETKISVSFENITETDFCKHPCHIHSQEIPNADATEVNDVFIHGFMGYFTAVLYGEIMIDTRHTSSGRNSFHWECFFFPLREPIRILSPSNPFCDLVIKLYLRRKCEKLTKLDKSLKLWYEWQVEVTGCVCDACMSSDEGKTQSKAVSKEQIGKAVNNSKLSDSSTATLLPSQMKKHKYPLQNAEGSCDAVFLHFKNSSGIS